MFRGNHPTRVDEKGRLKVPAEFKRVLDEKYGQQFYITSFDGKVAQVYPFEEWERIEQKLAGLSTFNPTKKKFLDRTNYWGQQVEIDGQGRLLMPQLLRESAQIKGEVAVTGMLTYLEVRNLEAYRREKLYVPSADAITVRVQLDALAVTRIGVTWPVGEVTTHDDGSAELIIDCEGFEWVTGWVLGLGRHAWIVSPAEARDAMRERIARVRELTSA
jgi:MraZ protein